MKKRDKLVMYINNGRFSLFQKCLFLFLIVLLSVTFSSCSTMSPSEAFLQQLSKQGIEVISESALQSEIEYFKQAKGIQCSEIPRFYDSSALKPGSMVEMKWSASRFPDKYFYFTKTLSNVEISDSENSLAINSKSSAKDATDAKSKSIGESTGELLISVSLIADIERNVAGTINNLSAISGSLQNIPSVPFGVSFLTAITGSLIDIYSRYKKNAEYENQYVSEMGQAMNKGQATSITALSKGDICKDDEKNQINSPAQNKIINFKLISHENLTIAGRSIPCKVYRVDRIFISGMPLEDKNHLNTQDFSNVNILKKSIKLWVSDEVPFGIVKSEEKWSSISTIVTMTKNSKTHQSNIEYNIIKSDGLIFISEVTEFSY